MRLFRTALSALALTCGMASPLAASTPAGVAELIDAALASGDAQAVDTVIRYAKQAHPQAAEAIDAQVAAYRTAIPLVAALAVPTVQGVPVEIRPIEVALVVPPVTKWSGEGELGAFSSTGNAPGIGLAGGFKLNSEGEDWRVALLARADYQETGKLVVREQYRFSVEPNYKFDARGFVYGLGQYERDRFQGFHARYSVSGGIGYSLLSEEEAKLNIKAGPAWRRTELVTGMTESVVAGLASVDFKLRLTPTLHLSEAASAYIDSERSTLFSVAALDSQLIGKLKARLSYTVQHESTPALGRAPTDTTSRLTLVYGF